MFRNPRLAFLAALALWLPGAGAMAACTQPANTPNGLTLTCVCDDFYRSSLNPSTIFGANWLVSTSDATGILPRIVNPGYLRLTNNTGNNAKAATVPGIFPAAGNYFSVEFRHYAYNGSGADGIAVTLSDYAVPAVPGAFGGTMGYAQKSNPGSDCTTPGGCPGFAGGWLGVALDEYGNYQNPIAGMIGGPGFIVQSVGMRGSGSGMNGYRWLGGTASLTPPIDNRTSTTPSRGHYYQVIVDARQEPTSTTVSVNRDTGAGYSPLISIPNVYARAVSLGFTQAPAPANWQVSFTGSTGGANNIHEIGNLRICAQTIHPPTGGIASGFNAIDEDYGNASGTPKPAIQSYLTGHIYMKLVGTPFKLNVAALANNQVQTTYVMSGTKNVTVKLVDNSDDVCALDSSQPNYCSAACKARTAVAGGSQTLSFAPANSGQKRSADFTLNSAYRKLAVIVGDSTTTACATDGFSVRPTGVTSVVSMADGTIDAATNDTTTGTPVFRAGHAPFNLTATVAGVAGNASGYTGVLKIKNAALLPVTPAAVKGTVVPVVFPAAVPGSGSSVASGSTFTFSEVGAFKLPGFPVSNTSAVRGVYDGVWDNNTTVVADRECASSDACDTLKLEGSWTGVDSVSTVNDCIQNSYTNTKTGGRYGCHFGLITNTAGIGRFIPYEFRVGNAKLINRKAAATAVNSQCPPPPRDPDLSKPPPSAFTYLDEAMGLSFTLEALSGAGNVTRNYAGALSKLDVTDSGKAFQNLNFGAAATPPAFAPLTDRLDAAGWAPLPPGSTSPTCYSGTNGWPVTPDDTGGCPSGVVKFDGTLTVRSRNWSRLLPPVPDRSREAPDGPFTKVQIGIAPVDSDGVTIPAYDLDIDDKSPKTADRRSLNPVPPPAPPYPSAEPTTLYFGLMRILPAYGSELMPAAAGVEVLRWNGAAFVPNGDDNCTRLPLANQGLRDYTKNLKAGETAITSGTLAIAAGRRAIVLSAPGTDNNGSVNLWSDLSAAGLGYLAGRWPALPAVADVTPVRHDNPPWATITFGTYKGQSIDMRENHFY